MVRSAKTCPEGRLSSPVQQRNGHLVLDLDSYIPYFLAAVNNALSSGASALYLARYGVGIVDWRILSTLAVEPGSAATRICELVSLDKAAVSRSLNKLSRDGYLDYDAPDRDQRRRIWTLNAVGFALHDEILVLALEREKDLIAGTDPADLEAFLRVMRTMRRNVSGLS
jgi:DNA-binding MarR family transcriptional regulator